MEPAHDGGGPAVDLGHLDITSTEDTLDGAANTIAVRLSCSPPYRLRPEPPPQDNLEDEMVRDALDRGVDLRVYSKQVHALRLARREPWLPPAPHAKRG